MSHDFMSSFLAECNKTDSKFKKALKVGCINIALMNTEITSNASKYIKR